MSFPEHFEKYCTIALDENSNTATFSYTVNFEPFTNTDGTQVSKDIQERELKLYLLTAVQEMTGYYDLDYELNQLKAAHNVPD